MIRMTFCRLMLKEPSCRAILIMVGIRGGLLHRAYSSLFAPDPCGFQSYCSLVPVPSQPADRVWSATIWYNSMIYHAPTSLAQSYSCSDCDPKCPFVMVLAVSLYSVIPGAVVWYKSHCNVYQQSRTWRLTGFDAF